MPVFAFTDIEGSTGMWEKYQDAMGPIIAKHYAILDHSIPEYGGRIVKKTGDGVFAVFPDELGNGPSRSLECALELQRRFQAEAWPIIGELRVRMGFHCGKAEEMAGDYYGPTANRTARFMSLGWGGQILVSEDLRKLAHLPTGAEWLDLGVHQVKDLPEPQHVFSLAHPSLFQREFPPLKSLSNRPHNLPEQLSPFVGRERELKAVAELLTQPHGRLVTLLGGGGMGKTRLAIQAGLANLAGFKHGACFVGLHGLASPDQLPGRLAQSLKMGLYRDKDPKEQLLEYLKDKSLLLILDPCERLASGGGLISELLEACPGLRVLACSRRRLNLRGESVVEVRGLDYPAAAEGLEHCDAAQFFVQRVQSSLPGFSLKPGDRGAFLRLCRVLRGMPLGLELAGSWLRSLQLPALAERLEKDPRFLASTREDLPEAHRSLKGLFESAWALLSDVEKRTLGDLSVFGNGFTQAAAQLVFRVRPETLSALTDQCLVEAAEGGRYAVVPAARIFAAVKLDENPARRDEALDLHARYFCRFLKEREKSMLGYEQGKAVAELRQDFADIQRGWDRAVAQGWHRELGQAARCVGLYTDMQGLARDWEPRMQRALQLWDGSPVSSPGNLAREESLSAHASLLANQANYLFSLGRGVDARAAMEKSVSLFKQAGNRGGAAYALVRVAVFLGPEDERRRPALEEAANLYTALDDANGAAWARRNLGYLYCLQGKAKEGKPMVEESLAVFRKVGNLREIAWSLNSLGQVALESGHAEEGEKGLREARDIFIGLGDLETAAWTLNRLGRAAMQQRRWPEAQASLEEGLRLFESVRNFRGRALTMRSLCELFAGQGSLDLAYQVVDKTIAEALAAGDWAGQAGAQMQKGQLMAGQGNYEEAMELMQAAEAAFVKGGSKLGQALAMEAQGCARLKQGKLGFTRTLFEGACQVFNTAGMMDGEARLCVRIGDLDGEEARPKSGENWYQRAVKLSRQSKPGDYSLGGLLGLAVLFHKAGRKLEALHLALVCERAIKLRMLPPSEPEFYAELGPRSEAVLALIGSKLMNSVIEEARAKIAQEDPRALLKDCLEKYWS